MCPTGATQTTKKENTDHCGSQGTAFELQSLEADAKSQEVLVRDAVDKAKESAKKAHGALQNLAEEQVRPAVSVDHHPAA